jgi:hypothetical protein
VKQSSEYEAFTKLVDRVLSVPHSVVRERIDKHREVSAQNPNRRGRKPKIERKTVKPPDS